MADIVSSAVEFLAANPIPVAFTLLLLGFVFYAYLFVRKTVKEFRRGMDGS